MRRIVASVLMACVAAAFLMTTGCASQKRVALWNGRDFAGWKFFLRGDDVDAVDVWSVENGVIHCKGKPNGYMRTTADYSNYKLHLEWRWAAEPTNSGVLLHTSGPDHVWPRSIECQLQAGNAGDFWLIGGTAITVDGKRVESPGRPTRSIKKAQSSEKAPGQWNAYDIICRGDTITCYVNGVLQNRGTNASDTSGKICLQSEGSPIEFRNIYIEHLD